MATPRKRIEPPPLAKLNADQEVESRPIETKLPRARTPEAREAQLAAMAYDLAERQFREGTASSQVIVHFLKVGSTREKVELQKQKQETLLVEARVRDLQNVEEMKQLYADAMDAMRGYSGQGGEETVDPNVY